MSRLLLSSIRPTFEERAKKKLTMSYFYCLSISACLATRNSLDDPSSPDSKPPTERKPTSSIKRSTPFENDFFSPPRTLPLPLSQSHNQTSHPPLMMLLEPPQLPPPPPPLRNPTSTRLTRDQARRSPLKVFPRRPRKDQGLLKKRIPMRRSSRMRVEARARRRRRKGRSARSSQRRKEKRETWFRFPSRRSLFLLR